MVAPASGVPTTALSARRIVGAPVRATGVYGATYTTPVDRVRMRAISRGIGVTGISGPVLKALGDIISGTPRERVSPGVVSTHVRQVAYSRITVALRGRTSERVTSCLTAPPSSSIVAKGGCRRGTAITPTAPVIPKGEGSLGNPEL